MSGGAAAAMLDARYGYGPSRGPRRMPARMANRFVTGVDDGSSFGDDDLDDEYGVDIPDDVFATEMASIGTGLGSVGRSIGHLAQYARPKYGDIGDAAVSEMFGEDDEDADLGDDGGDEGGGGGGFRLPKLPSWTLPAAIGTAAAAGAVGLGLALTSKKRRAKRAAREASEGSPEPSFGSMGDTVAIQMFGDPDDDEFFGWDFTDDQFRSMGFGEDPLPSVSVTPAFGPPPPTSVFGPPPTSSPTWNQYKAASRDVFRAGQQAARTADRLAESGAQRRVLEARQRAEAAAASGSDRKSFRAGMQLQRAEQHLSGSGVARRAAEAQQRLAAAQSALPSFPAIFGCTPSAYYGVYGSMDALTQQIGSIESQVVSMVTKFIPTLKRPIVLPQLLMLNQKRDKLIDQGLTSDAPQPSALEDQAMRMLSGLDQATASTLWMLSRKRDNLRRRLAGIPEQPIGQPPVLV